MCGRFTNQASWQDYHAALSGFPDGQHQSWKVPDEQFRPCYNLAPSQNAPILIADSAAGLEGMMARWDFVP